MTSWPDRETEAINFSSSLRDGSPPPPNNFSLPCSCVSHFPRTQDGMDSNLEADILCSCHLLGRPSQRQGVRAEVLVFRRGSGNHCAEPNLSNPSSTKASEDQRIESKSRRTRDGFGQSAQNLRKQSSRFTRKQLVAGVNSCNSPRDKMYPAKDAAPALHTIAQAGSWFLGLLEGTAHGALAAKAE